MPDLIWRLFGNKCDEENPYLTIAERCAQATTNVGSPQQTSTEQYACHG